MRITRHGPQSADSWIDRAGCLGYGRVTFSDQWVPCASTAASNGATRTFPVHWP